MITRPMAPSAGTGGRLRACSGPRDVRCHDLSRTYRLVVRVTVCVAVCAVRAVCVVCCVRCSHLVFRMCSSRNLVGERGRPGYQGALMHGGRSFSLHGRKRGLRQGPRPASEVAGASRVEKARRHPRPRSPQPCFCVHPFRQTCESEATACMLKGHTHNRGWA